MELQILLTVDKKLSEFFCVSNLGIRQCSDVLKHFDTTKLQYLSWPEGVVYRNHLLTDKITLTDSLSTRKSQIMK